MPLPRRLVLPTLLAVSAGCAGSLENPERFVDGGSAFVCPSLGQPAKVQVIDKKCVSGCHSAADNLGSLDLESAGAGARLVDVASAQCPPRKRVWSVDGGILQEKIQQSSPTCGGVMPPGGGLTNGEVNCIIEWTRHLVDGGTE